MSAREPPVPSKDRFLIFGSPAIEDPEIAEVLGTMRSGWLGTGPKVRPWNPTSCMHIIYTALGNETRVGISRDRFLNEMTYHGVGVGVHYLRIPKHPYFQNTFGWRPKDFPNAMAIGRQTVSLPISAKLTEADLQDVVAAIGRSLGRSS